MGVLHTGYLEKYNPSNYRTKKRFVVLTHVGLHWFKVNKRLSALDTESVIADSPVGPAGPGYSHVLMRTANSATYGSTIHTLLLTVSFPAQ